MPTKYEAANGVTFNIRVVHKGDFYGLDDCLLHDKIDPLVEFYDTRYLHTKYGQFVSRYYLSTLLERDNHGLNLQGDVDDWSIDSETMRLIKKDLKRHEN